MSEESKTPEGDYVMMNHTDRPKGGSVDMNDPDLSQEEKDHRLAISMQKQENEAAYNEHKKKADSYSKSQSNRTARSGTFTKLAAVRDKDHGMLSVPASYSSEHAYKVEGTFDPGFALPPKNAGPQEVTDHTLAVQLQKVEQVDAGTVRTMQKMVEEEEEIEETQARRTERSKCTL